MTIKTIESVKGMNDAISGIVRSAKSQRDNIQAVINFGGAHLEVHGDPCHLESALNKLRGVKSINTVTMLGYMKERFNVAVRNGDGDNLVFSKSKTGEPSAALNDVMWYEYNKPKTEKEDFSIEQLKSYLKRKAEAKEGVSQDARDMAGLALMAIVSQQVGDTKE